ncbi:Hypothetical protein A7982_03128 [Minicystis rosea]|nr:Hypothetical protein A7982_03128 [Minicystis rosea]
MTEAAERRALILQAADRLLRHYGPHKTTVADVAREAGVGVGTVYLEFPSKDAIVEELSRSRHRIVLASMRAAVNAADCTFRERLSTAFDARLEAYTAIVEEGVHACDLVHCAVGAAKAAPGSAAPPAIPGVKSALQSFWEEEIALVTDVLRRGAAAGELAVRDPEATARAVLRAYAGFSPPWITGRDREEVRRSIALMHEIVLYGVVSRAGGKPAPEAPRAPQKAASASRVAQKAAPKPRKSDRRR